jgi:hypothetical protein
MDREHDDDIARFEDAQTRLHDALSVVDGAVDAETRIRNLSIALRALDELREFVIRDLGTAVRNLERLEAGVGSLGEFVGAQREAINDLSATLAALVDHLVVGGVVDGDALWSRKNEILSGASIVNAGSKPD